MKSRVGLLIAFALFLAACSKPDAHDIDGNPFTVADQQGKWVVINYWATWCPPCIEEMPDLAKLHHAYPNDVMVIGINYDRLTPEKQRSFIHQKLIVPQLSEGIDYPLFQYFPAHELGLGHVQVLPTTFIINPQGELQETIVGEKTFDQFVELMDLESL